MARLKVKQISDFQSAVQNLIDNDSDQNASIIAQISSDLAAEITATNGDVSSIDGEISGLKSTDVVLSDALAAEITATNGDISSIDVVLGGLAGATTVSSLETRISVEEDQNSTDHATLSAALSTEIATTNSEVTSLEAVDGSLETRLSEEEDARASVDTALSGEIATEKGRIDAILSGSTTTLDQFAEVISYVDSLDTADGGALTSQIASLEAVVSTNTSNDVVLSAALSTEIATTNSEVTSLDTYIDGVSSDLAAEITATNGDVSSIDVVLGSVATAANVTSLDTYIDGVSADLSAEIAATNGEVTSLEGDVSSIDVRLDAADSGISSLDTALDGFAKEAYVHGAFSGIVTGGGMTELVVDTTGVQLDGGANATESGNTVNVDLVTAIEGNNDLEREANLVFVTINGQYVNHDAIRINSPLGFSVIGGQLGFNIEADDVFEFKYIAD